MTQPRGYVLIAALILWLVPFLSANASDLEGATQTDWALNQMALGQPGGHTSRAVASSIQVAATCFKSGERSSGMNKICYYDCLSGTVAITVGATDLCPLTINR